ncbi:MAG: DUF1566 domain-containing protein [Campylobacterales bacterium]|nr:DUF1566 domain-containing protein [Campylobacterales bacterium]
MQKVVMIMIMMAVSLYGERFSVDGDIVYDAKTNLYWQKVPSSEKFNFSDAIAYCENLEYGSQSDWRTPNLYELKSLVDYSKYKPAIATGLIAIKTDDWYWSSSKDVSSDTGAWVVNFYYGRDLWYDPSGTNYALCVRGE